MPWPSCAFKMLSIVWRDRLRHARLFRFGQSEALLSAALVHYEELAMASGLSLAELAHSITRDRGFLGDHECVSCSRFASRIVHLIAPLFSIIIRYPYIHVLLGQA